MLVSSVQTFRACRRVSELNSVPSLVLLLHWMMVTKKKTVSDLNIIVERLQDKVEHLAQKVKNMEALEKKVKHLEDELKQYKSNTGKESESVDRKKVQERVKCSKCEGLFTTKKMLKDHMKAYHVRDINCSDCDLTFDEQWKFERHLTLPVRGYILRGLGGGGAKSAPPLKINEGVVSNPRLLYRSLT